jgi:hypothetical protein
MTDQSQAINETTVPGIELVLNGGKKELDDATVPIRWFFSDEVLKRAPEYVVIIEQTALEAADDYSMSYGRRYLCKVTEAVKYLQLFTPGRHRLMVLAVNGKYAKKRAQELCCNNAVSITWPGDHADRQTSWTKLCNDYAIIAHATADFTVPKELFATKRDTAFSKAIWNWVNLWHRTEPRDQCQYRARKIFAFTLQPPLFLLLQIVKVAWFIIAILLVFIMSAGAFFFGWKITSVFKQIGQFYSHASCTTLQHDRYRLWRSGYDTASKRSIYMPFTLFELSIVLGYAWMLVNHQAVTLFLIQCQPALQITYTIVIWSIASLITAIVLYAWIERITNYIRPQKKEVEYKVDSKQQNWLKNHLRLDQKPGEILFKDLPEDSAVRFRAGFWTLKTRLCKPFSR